MHVLHAAAPDEVGSLGADTGNPRLPNPSEVAQEYFHTKVPDPHNQAMRPFDPESYPDTNQPLGNNIADVLEKLPPKEKPTRGMAPHVSEWLHGAMQQYSPHKFDENGDFLPGANSTNRQRSYITRGFIT